jgi:hypothetical protein
MIGGGRRVLAVSPPSSELALSFVGGAVLDAGTISSRGGKRTTAVTRIVTMRIGTASRASQGTATLSAFVETPDRRATVRVDGIVLGSAPRVIRRHAPIGTTFTHRIEIEVPVTAGEGSLNTTIGWEITTE